MASQSPFLPHELDAFVTSHHAHSLKCLHLNVRSLYNKEEDINDFINGFHFLFDAVMLSETWCRDDRDLFKFPSYQSYCVNRTNRRGGGVMLLLREHVNCELLSNFCICCDDFEIITARVNDCMFSVCYRPPSGNLPSFFCFYEQLLSFVSETGDYLVSAGDFNIDLLTISAPQKAMLTMLTSNGCENLIYVPTRVTTESETLLDLFITNIDSTKANSGVITWDLSDHLPIFALLRKQNFTINEKHQYISFQNITQTGLDNFRAELLLSDIPQILKIDDVDIAYSKLIDEISRVYKRHFPQKKFKLGKKIRKPWITPELLQKIKCKNALYHKFIKSKEPSILKEYKSLRNKLNKELRSHRKCYFQAEFDSCSKKPDMLWKKLNTVLNRRKSSPRVEKLFLGGHEIWGDDLANTFNDYFVSNSNSCASADITKFMPDSNPSSFFLRPFTESEVLSVFLSLKNSSSCDVEGMQVRPIKYVLDLICPYLTYIFNLSLASAIFPRRMQIARVSVLFKKGDINDIKNYRPISILPVLSKGLEKLIHVQMSNFFDKHNLISTAQFGFRKHLSTELALLQQKEFILTQFESKNLVLGLYIDFSKAFDCIHHSILLKKLETYGIRGHCLNLVKSYLDHRHQYVQIEHYRSDLKHISRGVPQGSILGPFLFIVYINDLVNIYSDAKYVMYADDASLFFSSPELGSLQNNTNTALRALQEWSAANVLQINTKKTKAVIFRPKSKQITCDHITILYTNEAIEIVSSVKILGVTFTQNMLWDLHIESVLGKLSRVVGMMARHRLILPFKIKLLVYNALFFSSLYYCFLVWGTTTYTNLERLHVLQKKFLRALFNVPYNSHTSDLFLKGNVIRVFTLYNYKLSIAFKREIKENLKFFHELSHLAKNTHSYGTRYIEQWKVVTARTSYSMQKLSYTLPTLLNSFHKLHIELKITSARTLREHFINSC